MKLCSLKLAHGVIMALEPAAPKPLLSSLLNSSTKKLNPKFWLVQEWKSYLRSFWSKSIVFLAGLQLHKCCVVLKHHEFILYRICKLEELRSPKSLTLFVYSKLRIYYQGKMDVVRAPIVETKSTWNSDSQRMWYPYLLRVNGLTYSWVCPEQSSWLVLSS